MASLESKAHLQDITAPRYMYVKVLVRGLRSGAQVASNLPLMWQKKLTKVMDCYRIPSSLQLESCYSPGVLYKMSIAVFNLYEYIAVFNFCGSALTCITIVGLIFADLNPHHTNTAYKYTAYGI